MSGFRKSPIERFSKPPSEQNLLAGHLAGHIKTPRLASVSRRDAGLWGAGRGRNESLIADYHIRHGGGTPVVRPRLGDWRRNLVGVAAALTRSDRE